jgi:hypothetical protein
MDINSNRRDFIKAAGVAALAAAALPVWAQTNKTTTIALVGVAHIHTPGYIDLIKKRSDVHIKYVWDHDADRASQHAKDTGAQAVSDLNVIWSDPEITAVVILSETNLHPELVKAAAKAGKTCSRKNRSPPPVTKAAKWPKPSTRPGCCSPPAISCGQIPNIFS